MARRGNHDGGEGVAGGRNAGDDGMRFGGDRVGLVSRIGLGRCEETDLPDLRIDNGARVPTRLHC